MQKVLVIKHGALGDFVLETGAMFDIRRRHPQAQLHLLTASAFVKMAKMMNIFDDILVDNRDSHLPLGILRGIAANGYDVIYDLQCSNRTRKRYFTILRWLCRGTYQWIDGRKKTCATITKRHALGSGSVKLEPIQLEWTPTDLSFMHSENPELDKLPERYVLLICGCSPTHPYKRWPVPFFCELAQRLAARGVAPVLIGTNAEAAEIGAVADACPAAVSLLNKTALLDVPEIARRALATVGNDTGPSHMAAMSGGPTIAIYDNRTRNSATRGPKSINLVSDSTIDQISVDMVWERLREYLP